MVSQIAEAKDTTVQTVFHVTHWKAGSQWVRAVLQEADPNRIVRKRVDPCGFANEAWVDGGIYTPVYTSYNVFREKMTDPDRVRVFVVIRDPRDTAVSWYHSLMYSHTDKDPTVGESRRLLKRLDKVDGLALVISNHLYGVIEIQRSWIEAGAKVFRYEDLLATPYETFGQVFGYCGIDLPARKMRRIVDRNSFARRTWWRFGRESVRSHLRKGIAGDWRNHFCDRLTKLFKVHHGKALALAGYEKDDSW